MDEWQRFKGYAARVVELFVGGSDSTAVSSETFSFFGMQSTLDPLWPRLNSLRLAHGLGWDAVPSILAFLSPKITALTLTLPRFHNVLSQPILSIASDRCHRLQELVFDVDTTFGPHLTNAAEGLIIACRDTLRTLEVRSTFKAEYLPIIANLPQLRSLKLEKAQIPHDFPSGGFPSLEEFIVLHFYGGPLQDFFERLHTTDLKVVKVHGINVVPSKESIAALSRFSTSLEVLEISGAAKLNLPSVLIPHLHFVNLKTLYVGCLRWDDGTHHGPCVFWTTDQAIAKLGVAMPNIAYLTLGSPTCPRVKCVTFLSLVTLSKACQNLETLTIRVDVGSMVAASVLGSESSETATTPDETHGSACKLRKLVVGLSTLPNHPDSGWLVATGLGKVFPSLSEVVDSDQDGWGKVGRKIRMIRQVLHTVQQ